jgi:putative ABC transport system permease protein
MVWLRRLWNTLRPGRMNRDIDRELAFHVAERARDLGADGLSADRAAREARLRFGHARVHAERVHDVNVSLRVEMFARNIRHSVRALRRTPAFTTAVVLTLALGIGANSAVFSALDAVLLRPLPFPEADRLVRLHQVHERSAETYIAPIRLEDWNRLNSTFEAISGYFVESVSDTSGDLPEMVRRAFVAPRFLDVWGVAPALGRGFTSGEYQAGSPSAVLVSHRYWRDRLGADPQVLRRTVRLGSRSFPVVGVMPASFLFPDRGVDLWFPVAMSPGLAAVRSATWYTGIARLKPGVTLEQAHANLAAVQQQLGEQYPETDRPIAAAITPLKEATVGGVGASLWLLFGAVSVLLLITCTNVTALLLARATERRRETSVRLSLGATRGTLAAQMLTEAGLLALAGGVLGVAAAVGASAAFRLTAGDIPRMDEVQVDWRIVMYTLAVTMAVAFTCGLLPAIGAGRHGAFGASSGSGRGEVSSRHSLQWLFVGAQVALSVTLLASAGLFLRSFHELSRVSPGFDSSHVLTFRMSGSWAETSDRARLVRRIDDTLSGLRAVPGIDMAATTTFLPGLPAQYESTFQLADGRADDGRTSLVAESRTVSPEYFATMRIPILRGAPCTRQPVGSARDVMVNSAFVDRYLSERPEPVGLHLSTPGSSSPPDRIVGLVGNARERGLERLPGPVVYSCFSAPNPTPHFLVRTETDLAVMARTIRLRLKELEPLRAVYDLAPLEERIGDSFTENRLRTTLLALFALTALTLAIVGLYGTLSYAVTVRRREIGLRLALGALRTEIVRQFLGQGLRVVGPACLCGLAISIAVARVLSGMLYGVSPSDTLTLSIVVALVLAVATVAALIPATRAALTEPVDALRQG